MNETDLRNNKPDSILDRAERIVTRLESLGLEVSPQSRPWLLREVWRNDEGRLLSMPPVSSSHVARVLNALIDTYEMSYILDFVTDISKRDANFFLKDSQVATAEMNTPGRDRQLELFVLAMCRSAGLAHSKMGEPDVVIADSSTKIGIACKRIRSKGGMTRSLEKAFEQIESSNMPGFAFLDVTSVVFGLDLFIDLPFGEHNAQQVEFDVRTTTPELRYRAIELSKQTTRVLGYILRVQVPVQVRQSTDWNVQGYYYRCPAARARVGTQRRLFDKYTKAILSGLTNNVWLD